MRARRTYAPPLWGVPGGLWYPPSLSASIFRRSAPGGSFIASGNSVDVAAMASSASSRKHSVKASLQVTELTKAGSSLTLVVSAEGQKLGEIEIGRGALYWTGGRRQTSKRIDWSHFANMMNKLALRRVKEPQRKRGLLHGLPSPTPQNGVRAREDVFASRAQVRARPQANGRGASAPLRLSAQGAQAYTCLMIVA